MLTDPWYHLRTTWVVSASGEDVRDIFREVDRLPSWWPVFRHAELLSEGDKDGVGRCVRTRARGLLPYSLECEFELTRVVIDGFTLAVRGDLVGNCQCTLHMESETTEVVFDWRVLPTKSWLRFLSRLARPLLVLNHLWVMRAGRRGMAEEARSRELLGPSIP